MPKSAAPTSVVPPTSTPATQAAGSLTRRGPYARVLLKLSGESLAAPGTPGLEPGEIQSIAREVRAAWETGAQIALVVGGGNFIRGASLAKIGNMHQATADQMGMLATIINGLALKEALKEAGLDTRVMSAIDVKSVAEPFIRGRALRHLEKRRVLVLVAGTGNPFCTTDTCAALRARELGCEVLLKATKVDGVYSADPRKDPTASRYDRLTFKDVLGKNLAVMDMTAFTMCQEGNVPVIVFDYKRPGNIRRIVEGESLGTLIQG